MEEIELQKVDKGTPPAGRLRLPAVSFADRWPPRAPHKKAAWYMGRTPKDSTARHEF